MEVGTAVGPKVGLPEGELVGPTVGILEGASVGVAEVSDESSNAITCESILATKEKYVQ